MLFLAGCGKGSSPAGPGPLPTPTPPSGGGGSNTVNLVLFYDINSNGTLEGNERFRIPETDVQVGLQSGRTAKGTGRVTLTDVPSGPQSLGVHPDTLPPFYVAPAPSTLRVPEDTQRDVAVPVRLHIGSNRPGYYMAFGDSISFGDGSGDGQGYRTRLLGKLERSFGPGGVMVNEGVPATNTDFGANRILGTLASVRPAYTLILYGTNDWNEASCRSHFPCHTISDLRLMVRRCKSMNSLPVLATIIPANPDRNIPERNHWVASMNELIRPMAAEEGALLADLEERFLSFGDLAQLYEDHVHPNDQGYEVMSAAWFEAIAHGSVAATPPQSQAFRLFSRP
jgi:lysophospholipase L1-like esterase